MHPMCEYIYADVYMSMHSLHGCDVSRIAVLIFWSRCIFQCVVSYFSVLLKKNSMLLLLRMLTVSLKKRSFFFSVLPFPE